jgi:hypothetical protein
MRLKCTCAIKNSKIKLTIETVDFTRKEHKALDMLGEPSLEFQKSYAGGFVFSVNRKIRHNFKYKIEVDGTQDFSAANAAVKDFIDDLRDAADTVMYNLMDIFDEEDFPKEVEYIDVSKDSPKYDNMNHNRAHHNPSDSHYIF